jgi:hypothetical protein
MVFIAALTASDLRRGDPFVEAVVAFLARLRAGIGAPLGGLRGYLAGGLAVRCYTGSRTTGDIDMFFTGGRVLIPPNSAVLVSADGTDHSLVFDHQYTPDFGLLHPDYADRAVDLPAPGGEGFPTSVLHPVDLAITKVARFQDHDRADIAALARLAAFDAEALARLGEQALGFAVGDPSFVRSNLRDAAEIVAAVRAEAT